MHKILSYLNILHDLQDELVAESTLVNPRPSNKWNA